MKLRDFLCDFLSKELTCDEAISKIVKFYVFYLLLIKLFIQKLYTIFIEAQCYDGISYQEILFMFFFMCYEY